MRTKSIVIADDHTLIAEAWSFLLSQKEGFEVVRIYDNTETLLQELDTLCPDIVILDVNIQPYSGLETAKMIKSKAPSIIIIAISMHNEISFANRMLGNGASAYVTKNSHQEEMFRAIDEALLGNQYICFEIQKQMNV